MTTNSHTYQPIADALRDQSLGYADICKMFKVSLRTVKRIKNEVGIVRSRGSKGKADKPFRQTFGRYRRQAKQRGLEFELSESEFRVLIGQPCNYCGDDPSNVAVKRNEQLAYNGIDRVDSKGGYCLENCVPCCALCNRMKLKLGIKEFISKCAQITARHARSLSALILLVIATSVLGFGTANVSGKLTTPNGTGAIPGYAYFQLENCGGNFPEVAGASITPTQKFVLNTDGTWSGVLSRNDEIQCNGSASTWWHLTYYQNGLQVGPARDFVCSQASCVFDGTGALTPITTYPAPPAPAQPLTGAESVVCSFPTTASTWSCTENMGTQQVVAEFFDLNNKQIFPDTATATDINTFTATWLQPQAGFMRVVNVGNWTPSVSFPNYLISNPTSDQSVAGDHALTLGGSLSAKRIEQRRIVDANTSGATLDAKLATACNDLPSSGGEIDVQLGTSAQQWSSSQFSCGSAAKPVRFTFDQGMPIQPGSSSVNMWKVEPGNVIDGFTLDCSTQPAYSGTVFQNDTSVAYIDASPSSSLTAIVNYHSLPNCSSITTGKHLQLQSTSSSTGIAYFYLINWRANGLGDGVYGTASNSGFVNAIPFINVQIGSAQNCLHANAVGGSVDNWMFAAGSVCEQLPSGSLAIKFESDGSANSTIRYWSLNGSAYDYTTWGNLSAGTAVAYDNYFNWRADGACSGNCGGTANDATYSTFNNHRFADSSVAYNFGSFGGVWLRSHSGNGFRFNAVDLNKAFTLYPNASSQMQLDGVGVGTAAIFDPAGVGTIKAGSGAGTFLGAFLYNGTGNVLNIPTAATSGENLTQTIGTGNITTAGTAVASLTTQAQTGITVTGALTSDSCTANIPASLPATWQTGIQFRCDVTAANTVTVNLINPTAGSITPVATQVNVRVTR